MSAYMVDRHHIRYLIEAAKSKGMSPYGFQWRHGGKTHGIIEEVPLANMLWQENLKSVMARYPDSTKDDLPGPIGETYEFTEDNFPTLRWAKFDPAQVVKACDCYAYQSCEHDEWEASEAKAFVDALRVHAARAMPGYDKAEWGAPAPLR